MKFAPKGVFELLKKNGLIECVVFDFIEKAANENLQCTIRIGKQIRAGWKLKMIVKFVFFFDDRLEILWNW